MVDSRLNWYYEYLLTIGKPGMDTKAAYKRLRSLTRLRQRLWVAMYQGTGYKMLIISNAGQTTEMPLHHSFSMLGDGLLSITTELNFLIRHFAINPNLTDNVNTTE
jgi:hypothetical protein